MDVIARLITDVPARPEDETMTCLVCEKVGELCDHFPLYQGLEL